MKEQMQLLEVLLEGRSDSFKAKVLEVVYRHNLDPNDPNLQILIATGQLEVLLEEMPDRLQAMVNRMGKPWRVSLRIEGAWQTAGFGVVIAIGFASLGFLAGWWSKSAQVYRHYSPAELAYLDRLWVMNSDRLIQCQEKRATTCEIMLQQSTERPIKAK
jgi:hypothetical protein